MRRIISKVWCHAVRERAAKLLSPKQLGIGIADGATAAAHAARRFLSVCGNGQGLLKLDFKNAFNAVERAHVLSAVATYFPELEPYSFATYSSPSWLFFGQHKLESAQGVQQGDPLGVLLFSLAIFSETDTPDCSFAVWYLDKATLGGSSQGVISGLERVISGCSKLGLELNVGKCKVVSADSTFSDQICARLPSRQSICSRAAWRATRTGCCGRIIYEESSFIAGRASTTSSYRSPRRSHHTTRVTRSSKNYLHS